MTTLDTFLPYVLPYVYGCPDVVALRALRMACTEFCRRTDAVQRVLPAVNVAANTQDYALTPPTDMLLARVLGVGWRDRWLNPVDTSEVQSFLALNGTAIDGVAPTAGDPAYWFQKTPDAATVSLHPIPVKALTAGLFIKASFYPTTSATSVDDWLFTEWVEDIAAGAVAKIRSQPGQPYSGDPMPFQVRFYSAIGQARRMAIQGKGANSLRVRPRSFV